MGRPATATIYAFAANSTVLMAPDIPSTETDGSLSKSVLICPTCDHESPSDGDWRESRCDTAGGPKIALICPECATDITYRPIESDTEHEPVVQPTTR